MVEHLRATALVVAKPEVRVAQSDAGHRVDVGYVAAPAEPDPTTGGALSLKADRTEEGGEDEAEKKRRSRQIPGNAGNGAPQVEKGGRNVAGYNRVIGDTSADLTHPQHNPSPTA